MSFHRNAKLGLAGRLALVQAIEGGMSLRAAAAAFSVSPATAHRWWHRWREAGEQARSNLACLLDRSSRPRRSPRELAPELQERICACRRETGWGPRLVAAVTGFAHSTVWKVLKRAGISRPDTDARSRGLRLDAARRPAPAGLGRRGGAQPGLREARDARPLPALARARPARVPVRAPRERARDPVSYGRRARQPATKRRAASRFASTATTTRPHKGCRATAETATRKRRTSRPKPIR
jgi:transposase